MDNERLLKDLGLTKYESSAYATLIKEGIIGAQELSRISGIPVGKIYEVLSNLNNMGLVESQKSRPRKYRAVKPKVALNNLYNKKEEETKHELEKFKLKVAEIEEKFADITTPDHTEVKFWSTVLGYEDIMRNIKNTLDETEKEILQVHSGKKKDHIKQHKCFDPTVILPLVADEFAEVAKKGVNVKMIVPGELASNAFNIFKERFGSIEDDATRKKIAQHLEIKILECDYEFAIIDNYLTFIPIPDPLEPNIIFGEVKMYDKDYAKKLKTKFNELWAKGEKTNFT
ncbi:helix-turn-helix domain-containing protein [Methanolobus sp. ZRKC2]|uniref:TrmB family transcriptional regulator n=1 Tax=Methanolobus sp. ZRKC2 TaxID=3125783 RepID=UPI00324BE28E